MAESDITRLKQEIELEYRAARRGFEGSAITSPHQFIHTRLARIAQCHEALKQHLGEQEATRIVLEVQRTTIIK